jgi:hypothetical protein
LSVAPWGCFWSLLHLENLVFFSPLARSILPGWGRQQIAPYCSTTPWCCWTPTRVRGLRFPIVQQLVIWLLQQKCTERTLVLSQIPFPPWYELFV